MYFIFSGNLDYFLYANDHFKQELADILYQFCEATGACEPEQRSWPIFRGCFNNGNPTSVTVAPSRCVSLTNVIKQANSILRSLKEKISTEEWKEDVSQPPPLEDTESRHCFVTFAFEFVFVSVDQPPSMESRENTTADLGSRSPHSYNGIQKIIRVAQRESESGHTRILSENNSNDIVDPPNDSELQWGNIYFYERCPRSPPIVAREPSSQSEDEEGKDPSSEDKWESPPPSPVGPAGQDEDVFISLQTPLSSSSDSWESDRKGGTDKGMAEINSSSDDGEKEPFSWNSPHPPWRIEHLKRDHFKFRRDGGVDSYGGNIDSVIIHIKERYPCQSFIDKEWGKLEREFQKSLGRMESRLEEGRNGVTTTIPSTSV